jgi:hypothetical protein
MKPNLLLLGVGVFAALSFACTPIVTSPASLVAGSPFLPSSCTATDFLNKVSFLTNPPVISQGGLSATPGTALPSSYVAGLTGLFNAAPSAFQQVLCRAGASPPLGVAPDIGLDLVYVIGSCTGPTCFGSSEGWWHQTSTGGHQRIVELSSSLWSYNYSGYETALTQSLLPQSGITYTSANIDNVNGMALLAALAHEVGHIRWYEWGLSNPVSYCGGGFFGGWDASRTRFQPPPMASGGYYREFLDLAARNKVRPTPPPPPPGPPHQGYPYVHGSGGGPQIDDIDNTPHGASQNAALRNLLWPPSTSPWPSLFAALSPDEDFVETYKLKVLLAASPPLNSVSLGIPPFNPLNIPQDIASNSRPQLASKLSCINSF